MSEHPVPTGAALEEPYLGTTEVARLLGVTKQYVSGKLRYKPGFPEPVARLAMGSIWARADIEEWNRVRRTHEHGE